MRFGPCLAFRSTCDHLCDGVGAAQSSRLCGCQVLMKTRFLNSDDFLAARSNARLAATLRGAATRAAGMFLAEKWR